MAIGDNFAVFLGTAETSRQPSSGVEEQLSMLLIDGGTDVFEAFNGSTSKPILIAAARTTQVHGDAAAVYASLFNIAWNFNNTTYIRKSGTTDMVFISGVQTNA